MEPIDYKDLVGLPYIPEVNDCYQIIRKYYAKLGIELRDYAFPSDFWAFDENLYMKHYADEGFAKIVTDDWKPQLHDVMLVLGSLATTVPTHAGILVEPNKVLHHFTGRFSEVNDFRTNWRSPAVVFRHKSITMPEQDMTEVVLSELMPRHIREKFVKGLTEPTPGAVQ